LNSINDDNQPISRTIKSDTFFVKSENKFYPLILDEINWISTSGNYCTISTMTQQDFVVRISLTKIKDYLIRGVFVQINKKDLININKIRMYDPIGIVFIGTKEFSVSRRFKKRLEDSLQFLP